jgi:hypothetical protein
MKVKNYLVLVALLSLSSGKSRSNAISVMFLRSSHETMVLEKAPHMHYLNV